jgi:hypothetical protein
MRWHSQFRALGANTVNCSRSRSLIAPGAEGRDKTEQLLRTLYSLLRDLMFLGSGAPELVQNTDIQSQLTKWPSPRISNGSPAASDRLAEVERGMRRNLLRSLSLDGFRVWRWKRQVRNL